MRLTAVGWALQHEYRALRSVDRGTTNDAAPVRFAARLVALARSSSNWGNS
ncbi:MAG: hypothetical protein ABI292_10825 [Rhodoferax sp.]